METLWNFGNDLFSPDVLLGQKTIESGVSFVKMDIYKYQRTSTVVQYVLVIVFKCIYILAVLTGLLWILKQANNVHGY